jgi:hypothetical protein
MDKIARPFRTANIFRSPRAGQTSGFHSVPRDFSLESAAGVTRKRHAALIFSAEDPERLLLRFTALGGDCKLVQFCSTRGDVENLLGWFKLWKPALVIFDRGDDHVYLLTSIKFDNAPGPLGARRPAPRAQLRGDLQQWSAQARGQGR